jgi:hypothetical protein
MMSPQTCDVLAHRLSVAERQLAIDRTEIAALRRDLSGHLRSRWIANVFTVAGIVVAALLVRSSNPQAQAAGSVVKAPFVVVDAANQPILKVQDASPEQGPRGALVLNAQGHIVAHLSVRSNGHGAVFARHGTKGLQGPGAGMYFDDDGNGAFGMRGTDGKSIIEINRNALSIYDPASLHVFNSSKHAAVTLEVSKSGSGYFSIGDAGGEAVVEAGVAVDSGVGQVRAGPASAPKGQGIPPSFIKGWKKK